VERFFFSRGKEFLRDRGGTFFVPAAFEKSGVGSRKPKRGIIWRGASVEEDRAEKEANGPPRRPAGRSGLGSQKHFVVPGTSLANGGGVDRELLRSGADPPTEGEKSGTSKRSDDNVSNARCATPNIDRADGFHGKKHECTSGAHRVVRPRRFEEAAPGIRRTGSGNYSHDRGRKGRAGPRAGEAFPLWIQRCRPGFSSLRGRLAVAKLIGGGHSSRGRRQAAYDGGVDKVLRAAKPNTSPEPP